MGQIRTETGNFIAEYRLYKHFEDKKPFLGNEFLENSVAYLLPYPEIHL